VGGRLEEKGGRIGNLLGCVGGVFIGGSWFIFSCVLCLYGVGGGTLGEL